MLQSSVMTAEYRARSHGWATSVRGELHTLASRKKIIEKLVNIPLHTGQIPGVVNHLNRRFSLIAGHQSFYHFRLEQRLGNPYSNKEQGKSGPVY